MNIFDLDLESDFSNKPKNNIKVDDNQLVLPSGKIITFNSEQYEAINRIREWLKNKKSKFFTLSGPAGSGKSTIVKKLLEEYRGGVCISSPTHKAKKNLIRITGRNGSTLHSLLGLRPDVALENFLPNFPEFAPIAPPKIDSYNWVIIDESSMLNLHLFNLICELIKNCSTKILFIGDKFQLPPVSETESVIFSHEEIEKYFITKVERQKGDNPLMFIYDKIRNNINEINIDFERKTNINDNNEGIIFTVNKREFRKLIVDKFKSEEYKKDSDFIKGLAWRNETVIKSNDAIRSELFGNNADFIEVGDVLMGYRNITNETQTINIIENSADYLVLSKSGLEENQYGIQGYRIKIREEYNYKEYKYQDIFVVDIKNFTNLHLYAQMHDFFRDQAKSNKKLWNKYYEFRRNNILMVDIDRYMNGQLRNKKDYIKLDINYGYFLTIHKSQGSTYQHVAILEEDINDNWIVREKNQLFYVALSRPEKTAIVLTTKIDL